MAPVGKRKARPASHRAFDALLCLYPPGFRDEYGRELALVCADRYRDASGSSARGRLWLEAVAGVLAAGDERRGQPARQRHEGQAEQPLRASRVNPVEAMRAE